jgi:uncharacterized surface protein with fasciclin (FAS1) repeats
MTSNSVRKSLAMVSIASLAMFTAACGSDDTEASTASGDTTTEAPSDSADDAGGSQAEPAMANLAGPGCADYAEAVPSGDGSIDGMAQDPVATAASNNPLLKTLTATVTGAYNPKVDLVDTLNGGEFTVFAPVDSAFEAVDGKTLKALAQPANADMLSSILTYHVIPGQMTPEQLSGSYATAQGDKVSVSGQPDALKINGNEASVVCGGVQTANATVYLIDSVLLPPSM